MCVRRVDFLCSGALQRDQRDPERDPDIERVGQRRRRLWKLGEERKGGLKKADRFAIGRAGHSLRAGLTQVGNSLRGDASAHSVMREDLRLLSQTTGVEPFERLDELGVQCASPVLKQSLVGHFVRERVLERVLEVREEPDLVEELRGLETAQLGAHLFLRRVGNGEQQRDGHVLADDGSRLEQPLVIGGQAVDARGQDGLNSGGYPQLFNRPSEPVGATFTGEGARLNKGAHALLEEEWIGVRPLDQQDLERGEGRVGAEKHIEQLVGVLGWQGIDPELAVVGFSAPGVAVLRAVVGEEQEARRWQALDETVEEALGLAVNPVQVLEDHNQGLDLALAQQQTLDRVQRLLAPLARIESLPGRLLDWHVEEREEGEHSGGKGWVQRQDLPRYLLPDLPRVVAALKLEVAAKEIDDRQVGGRLAVGGRAGFKHAPAVDVRRVG